MKKKKRKERSDYQRILSELIIYKESRGLRVDNYSALTLIKEWIKLIPLWIIKILSIKK